MLVGGLNFGELIRNIGEDTIHIRAQLINITIKLKITKEREIKQIMK